MTHKSREIYFENLAKVEMADTQTKFLRENQVIDHYPLTQDLGEVGLGTGITFMKTVDKGQNVSVKGKAYSKPGRMTMKEFRRK